MRRFESSFPRQTKRTGFIPVLFVWQGKSYCVLPFVALPRMKFASEAKGGVCSQAKALPKLIPNGNASSLPRLCFFYFRQVSYLSFLFGKERVIANLSFVCKANGMRCASVTKAVVSGWGSTTRRMSFGGSQLASIRLGTTRCLWQRILLFCQKRAGFEILPSVC